MILSVHQPEYLPYMGFFLKMMLCDEFVIMDHVQYSKQSWQNRNRIRSKDGELLLTVPVLTKGKSGQAINEVQINNCDNWMKKHLRSMVSNYCKTPFFDVHRPFFEDIYSKRWEKLVDLNMAIIKYLVTQLGIRITIVRTSEFGPSGQKTDLLIDICKRLGFDTYLSGSGGRLYIDEARFRDQNLKSLYVDFKHPVYKQQYEPFLANMSLIDLLFNYGSEQSSEIIKSSGRIA
ncbi:MAG: WbqC family protein [Candidatus Saganbacteria bacterium]|nr:WbqC family protein [Candidatus Saganbacteria bacterium]